MPAVEAEAGKIDVSETRSFGAVRKGYTPFRKDTTSYSPRSRRAWRTARWQVVPDLVSEYGFGSTEFHVLRPADGVDPRFIYHAVSNRAFRFHAEHNMTGAVGQKRVPATSILEEHRNRVAANERATPNRRQDRGSLRRDRTRGVESLRDAKKTINLYRQSLAQVRLRRADSPPSGEPRTPPSWNAPTSSFPAYARNAKRAMGLPSKTGSELVAEWTKRSGRTARNPQSRSSRAGFDLLWTSECLPWPSVHVLGRCSTHRSSTVFGPRNGKDK